MSINHTSTPPTRTGKRGGTVKPPPTPREIVASVALKSQATAKRIKKANSSGYGRARLL